MVRKVERLSAIDARRARARGYYHDGGGLYLAIDGSGNRSWIFRYGAQGRHHHGLGPLHTVNLTEAREKAKECRFLLLEGKDPITVKRARKAAAAAEAAKQITFKAAAETFITDHHPAWKNPKNRQQWESTLATYAYPVLGRFPVSTIDTGQVMRVLQPIWTGKPETAGRVRMRIERVLGWASVHGYRNGENPARWKGHLDHLLPAQSKVAPVQHHTALPYTEIPGFIRALRTHNGSAVALEFLILTAARTGEVLGAEWEEFDLEAHTWKIPAKRMKSGRDHRVPLSARAVEILTATPRKGRKPFPFASNVFLQLLHRMGHDGLTGHGFRSSFRDWAAEQHEASCDVAEMALAHAVSDKTEAAYRRSDLFAKRRELMDDWAAFCTGE